MLRPIKDDVSEEGAGVFVDFDVLYCSRDEAIGKGAAAAEMCDF
jgi:hypothetical protein